MVTNAQNSWIATAIKNRSSGIISGCPRKRSMEESVASPEREYYERPEGPEEQTIGELIAAGSDPAHIMSSVCQLTNDIHPVFRDENICACEYAEMYHCAAPQLANSEGFPRTTPSRALLAHPKNCVVIRTILQLASQMTTHPQALPFWAGLINAIATDDEEDRADFEVHPTRLLDPAHTKSTLLALEKLASNMRVHIKDFGYDGKVTPVVGGVAPIMYVRDVDPEYKEWVKQHYAYRDGRATVESSNRPFVHVFINLSKCESLRSSKALMGMTMTGMKVDMFGMASTVCHEFAHALEQHHCDCFPMPPMNDEPLVETGYSLENFLFGGLFQKWETPCLQRWPQPFLYDCHTSNNYPMDARLFADLGPDRNFPIELAKIAALLEQSFWDDPKPLVGCWKKMWLRPHVEVALNEDDYDYYNSGSKSSSDPPKKRRRLSDAAMERQRADDANEKWEEYMEVEVRWHRRKEVSAERKAVFHEREMIKLNGLWEECMKGIVPAW
jgi:hypothetical protein